MPSHSQPGNPESPLNLQHVGIARRALIAAIGLGVLGDLLLRHEPWGLGLGAWMGVFAATLTAITRPFGARLSAEGRVWLTCAVVFGLLLSWRDSGLLNAFNVMAMLAALVLLSMHLARYPAASLGTARPRTWCTVRPRRRSTWGPASSRWCSWTRTCSPRV